MNKRASFTSLTGLGLLVILVYSMTTLSSCMWADKGPDSILVIAVEGLGSESISCTSEDEKNGGFEKFCQESVRFTHAYTSSIMSQASLGSILTGKYPLELGLWHNGSKFLSAKEVTIAEAAVSLGFKTAFISGGAPIWRKSGLSQGFEVFDDNIEVSRNKLYRPAKRVIDRFINWLGGIPSSKPFLSVLYLADIQFPEIETHEDESGAVRPRDISGQKMEIAETLERLQKKLKKMRRWDKTHVVLVGLNGKSFSNRWSEIRGTNLFGENTRVSLLVKPSQKRERDLGVKWKIDNNISLVDLGKTLFDLLEWPINEKGESDSGFKKISFKEALKSPKVTWSEDRSLLIESGWANWRGVGVTRFAVKKHHFLYIYDSFPEVYDSLIDRREVQPMDIANPVLDAIKMDVENMLVKSGYQPWKKLPTSLIEKLKRGRTFWNESMPGGVDSREQSLAILSKKRPWDQQIFGWLAYLALKKEDWRLLKRLGVKANVPIWSYVAAINLNEKSDSTLDSCSRYFLKKGKRWNKLSLRQCDDSLFLSLLDWVHWKKNPGRDRLRQKFLRNYKYYKLDEEIAISNIKTGLFWDTAIDTPYEPSLVDLYLALPSKVKYKRAVEKSYRSNY